MKLIKFYTTWCGPCKMMNNVLKEADLTGVELVTVDVEVETDMKIKYDIQSVPVLVFESNGIEYDRLHGFVPQEVIEEKLNILVPHRRNYECEL